MGAETNLDEELMVVEFLEPTHWLGQTGYHLISYRLLEGDAYTSASFPEASK